VIRWRSINDVGMAALTDNTAKKIADIDSRTAFIVVG